MKCAHCGKEFRAYKLRQKYCSRECAIKALCDINKTRRRAERTVRKCAHCGAEFMPQRRNQIYCSNQCRITFHRSRELKEVVEKPLKPPKEYIPPFAWKAKRRACLKCGKEFEEHFKGDKFCSDDCCWQYYHPQVKEAFVNVFRDIMGKGRLKW